MIIRLINVGKNRKCGIIDTPNMDTAITEVRKYLKSSIVELVESTNKDIYRVVVGHLRTVGHIEILTWGAKNKLYTPKNLPIHIIRHSPTGMSWGYNGSGPADLALSLLTEVVGFNWAELIYQKFKQEVVSKFNDRWAITTENIQDWYIDNFNN